jgi:hypothetical protein
MQQAELFLQGYTIVELGAQPDKDSVAYFAVTDIFACKALCNSKWVSLFPTISM